MYLSKVIIIVIRRRYKAVMCCLCLGELEHFRHRLSDWTASIFSNFFCFVGYCNSGGPSAAANWSGKDMGRQFWSHLFRETSLVTRPALLTFNMAAWTLEQLHHTRIACRFISMQPSYSSISGLMSPPLLHHTEVQHFFLFFYTEL